MTDHQRMDHYPIAEQPRRGETGFEAYARDLARAVCAVAGGQRWDAEATAPAWPSRDVEQHSRIDITVDDHLRVVVDQTNPSGGALEQWRITVNGQPIPHRVFPGEAPPQIDPVARSLWRHLNDVGVDPCDRLVCAKPATVATWGSSTCETHAEPSVQPQRPAPSTAPTPPLPRLHTGPISPAHSQPKGVRR